MDIQLFLKQILEGRLNFDNYIISGELFNQRSEDQQALKDIEEYLKNIKQYISANNAIFIDLKAEGIYLPRINAHNLEFTNVDFTRAYLAGGSFYNATFTRSDLTEAQLNNTSFSGATLEDTILNGANTDHINMKGAKLNNVDISGITDLNESFKKAFYKGTITVSEEHSQTLQPSLPVLVIQ